MIRLKSPSQIAGIRRSCSLLASVMEELEHLVEPGVTTRVLDARAREMIGDNGGRPAFLGYHGFPGALCVSVNEEVIHGFPSDRVLLNGDVVSIDCGIAKEGYFSDSAITVGVGTVSSQVDQLLKRTYEALWNGIAAATAGRRVNDISRSVFRTVEPHGYGIVRPYCGHGVGLELHEDPQVPNYVGRGPNPRLKPGMVIAIEPMVNLGGDAVELLDDDWTVVTRDRSVSAHFEHTVVILKESTEVLTRRAGERVFAEAQQI